MRSIREFRLLDQYLSGRFSLSDLAAVVSRTPEVGGIEAELTNSVRNVQVVASGLLQIKKPEDLRH